jgi:O-antigen ligase
MLGFDMDDILLAIYGDTTFTTRTDLWSFIYGYIQQSPLLGHGFRDFWFPDASSPKLISPIHFIRQTGSSHNGFIEIMLDLGLAGLGLLILFILAALHMAGKFNLCPTHRSLFYLSVIVFVIGRNMMESVLLWSTFLDNLSFLLVSFLACYRESPSGMRFHVTTRPAGIPVKQVA